MSGENPEDLLVIAMGRQQNGAIETELGDEVFQLVVELPVLQQLDNEVKVFRLALGQNAVQHFRMISGHRIGVEQSVEVRFFRSQTSCVSVALITEFLHRLHYDAPGLVGHVYFVVQNP